MIRTRDRIGLAIAAVCLLASTWDVFGYRRDERSRAHVACVVAGKVEPGWPPSHRVTHPVTGDDERCAGPVAVIAE